MNQGAFFDTFHAVTDVQLLAANGVGFCADGMADLIGDMHDGIVTGIMYGGVHGAAAAVPHHDNKLYAQMLSGIFDAAKLKIADDVARHTDGKDFPDANHEDFFRDDPGVRAGDDDRVRLLTIFVGEDTDLLGDVALSFLCDKIFLIARHQAV